MQPQSIYAKTAKGILEVKNKTIRLTRELGLVFLAVDGKTPVSELGAKSALPADALAGAIEKLVAGGYLKLIAEQPAADGSDDDLDLDFTSPAKVAKLNQEVEERAKAETAAKTQAESSARAAAEAKGRQETQAREHAAAENKAREETAAKLKAEEAARAAAQAGAKAQQEANAATETKARAEAEARMRAAMQEKARADTEAQARAAAEARARIEAEAKARAEASARMEAEARAKAETEARARAAAEARARIAIETKMRAMEQALKDAEARAKSEVEARIRAETDAAAKAAREAILREEAETRTRAELQALEENIRKTREEAKAREQTERKAREEAEARAAFERKAREEAETRAAAELKSYEEKLRAAHEEGEAKAAAERKAYEAQAQSRQQEAQAQTEAERRAREEAEMRAKMETAAREQAEANARSASEEAQVRSDAERKAREEAEARARAESAARIEVEARVETERKAREAAEAKAEGERKIREEAERNSQAELDARFESERKAREEAERRAQAVLDISRTAEKLIKEAADKQTGEAEKARAEAQRMLDSSRLAHEQAVAKAQAEMMGRVQAEQKAILEKRARAAAEDRAKQEAVARVMQEHQSRQRAETEIAAKVEAELKSREQAEFDADLRARQDAQQRAEAAAAQRAQEKGNPAASGTTAASARKRTPWGRVVFIGAILIVGCGVGLLQVLPLSGLRVRAEALLSDRLQQPVSIASFRFLLFPSPQIRVDRIAIGRSQEITIESAVVPVPLKTLIEENKEFEEAQLTNVKIEQSALAHMAAFSKARSAETQLNFDSLRLTGVQMTLGDIELPPFEATVKLSANGAFQKAQIRHPKITLDLAPIKEGGALRVNFSGKGIQSAVGPGLEYVFLSGTAVVDMRQASVSNLDARIANGSLTGGFNLAWSEKQFRAQGELNLKGADLALLLPAFTREFQLSGILELNTKFSSQGATLDELFAAPTATSTFTSTKGSLNNIDLVRAIQSRGRLPQRGGRTPYNEITGEAQASGGRIAFRNLKLVSGPMNGSGSVDVSAASALSGRLDLVLGSQSVVVAKGTLTVGGSLKDPQLSQ